MNSGRLRPGVMVVFRSGPDGRDRSWTQGEVIEAREGVRVRWTAYPESAGLYRYEPRELVRIDMEPQS